MLQDVKIKANAKNNIHFDPQLAFSRSLGWLTVDEQLKLSQACIGIVGLGGVGGQYVEVLGRLGIRRFVIYDQDSFSIENSNRQNECKTTNYGRNKAEVMGELIKDINPTAEVQVNARALNIEDVNSFCDSVDIYLDSLDFFEIDVRIAIFRRMRELGKPSMTLAPVGTGSAFLLFTKDSMSFDNYFGFHTTQNITDRAILFILGVAPSLMHSRYVQETDRIDFDNGKVPSLPMGVYSCASMAATLIMKIVLNRGDLYPAPRSIHYDPYLLKIKRMYIFWGYRNPIQRLKFFILKYTFGKRNKF